MGGGLGTRTLNLDSDLDVLSELQDIRPISSPVSTLAALFVK